MKTAILISLILFNVVRAFGQNINEPKYRLANAIFNSKIYQKKEYPKFEKSIEILENGSFKFGDKFFKTDVDNEEIKDILKYGVFNPDVIFGKETTHKTKNEIESLKQDQKTLYNFTRNDSLAICCFERLENLEPDFKTKRYKFWVIRIGILNPTEYYIELYNPIATKETTITKFIEGSKMSFYYKGTLII